MIILIKPITIELFPGSVTLTRADINTSSFQKSQDGVTIPYSLQAIAQKDVTSTELQDVASVNEAGETVITQVPVQVVTTVDYATYALPLWAKLTEDQWNAWPEGDANSDAEYIAECVLKNTGLERA